MKPIVSVALGLLLSLQLSAAEQRPANWAQPLTVAGIPNLHQLQDNVFRSAQPSALGMRNLEQIGVRTVINLRNFASDKQELRSTRLALEELNINTWSVDDRDVIRVLRILRQPERGPFLIHCKHGADRTGLMAAMYRIVEQGWSKQAALQEMRQGGYGYHSMWKNLIRYIEKVDVEKIRAAL